MNRISNEELVKQIKSGESVNENMEQLYLNNRPLIRQHIKKYLAFDTEEDLMQEAYICLVKAVEKYDADMDIQFMTYCGKCIDTGIKRYLEDTGALIRIPSYLKSKIYRYKKCINQFEMENGRIPTENEIAAITSLSIDEIEIVKQYLYNISSLDSPISDNDSLTLSECVKDDFNLEDAVVDKLIDEAKKNEIWGIVEALTDTRESDVIHNYFLHNKTMPQIANEMGISHQRVREIKEKGLRKLKRPKAKRILQEKYAIHDYKNYHNGVGRFKETFTSKVEHIVIVRDEIEREYRERVNQLLNNA